MPRQLVECVPNFSEGRDAGKIDAIVQAILAVPEVVLLDRESDADHNRSVLTFVGPPAAVADAAFRAVEKAVALIDLTKHQGAHPRIGAADVVPFIPIEGVTLEECVKLAERLGAEIWNKLKVPVYLYEAAARRPERANLENIRRGQFEALVQEMGTVPARDPDIGDPVCHPTAGAIVTGARKFLIAYNVNLNTPDVAIAKRSPRRIRFSSGGFRYVKSMGVMLASRNLAQVSINLTDFEQTPMHLVFETVRREAERYGVSVVGSEIVGLIPQEGHRTVRRVLPALREFPPGTGAGESHRGGARGAQRTARVSGRAGLAHRHSGRRQRRGRGGGDGRRARGDGDAGWPNWIATPSKRTARFFTEAVDRDAEAFNRVMAAYKRPKDERAPFVEEALHGAAEVPLQVMERVHAMQQRVWTRWRFRRRFASDLAVAKALAIAARAGALENVNINLDSIQDEAFKRAWLRAASWMRPVCRSQRRLGAGHERPRGVPAP